MKKLLLCTAAFTAIAGTAFAADLPRRAAPVVVPVAAPAGFDWTGAYIGAQIGYAWSNATIVDGVGPYKLNGRGAFGGLHLGYNWQMPSNIVLGLEGDVNYGDVRGSVLDTVTGITTTTKLDWAGSVRARLGYAFGNVLPYVTGGVAFGNIQHGFFDTGASEFYRGTRTGWTLGGGLEYAFDRNWSGRLEYRYTDYGSKNFTGPFAGDHAVKFNTHDVKAGVSYRF